MRLVVDHIPDPVILGTCDNQVVSMMQKAFGLKDTNQNRDVMFSLIRMDDYSSDPPSVLTIYTLENDDHDAFYFKLVRSFFEYFNQHFLRLKLSWIAKTSASLSLMLD